MAGRLRVGLLGPLTVELDGRELAIGGARRRAILAGLAMSAGAPVAVETLGLLGWGDRPPNGVRNALQVTVLRLRGELGAELIESVPDGYRLRIDPDGVDVHRFRALVATAATPGDPEQLLARLDEALALWRGEPFAGVDGSSCGPTTYRG